MIRASRTLSSIQVGAVADWSEAPYLSIDIDWAHDDVLADTIDLVEEYRVPVTWFVTHDTPLLARLRSHPDFELGIHPNFNFLLSGDSRAGRNATEVVDRLMDRAGSKVGAQPFNDTEFRPARSFRTSRTDP